MNAPWLTLRHQLVTISWLVGLIGFVSLPSLAQEAADSPDASIRSEGGRIVIETGGQLPTPPVYYSATVTAVAKVGANRVHQTLQLRVKVIQGEAEWIGFGLNGDGEVLQVEGQNIKAWSVRKQGGKRFLDLQLKEKSTHLQAKIVTRSRELQLPTTVGLTHLAPGEAVGFDARVRVEYDPAVAGSVTKVNGFTPLETPQGTDGFQTSTGGLIEIRLNRGGAAPPAVALTGTTLRGTMHANGDSADFELRTTAHVTDTDAEITLLSGAAAIGKLPAGGDYRIRLVTGRKKQSVYKIKFARAGKHELSLDFVAPVQLTAQTGFRWIDFTVAAGAVVPVTISGLADGLEFKSWKQAIVPVREGDDWRGFLPASGRALLEWKPARVAGEGKLFFTTTGRIEAQLGAGLLRQDHHLQYKVLQGELTALSLLLRGPGDILDVRGDHIVGWKLSPEGDDRRLDITLGRPITATSKLHIRSQTPLDTLPVRVEGLRLNPVGAIRHSGHLRLTNHGSVRLEPAGLTGLTQLAPNQFPGQATAARQTFVYRFPAADYAFSVAADRIQPEVNISQLLLYQLAETDRVIRANIELDIREAPIREWDVTIPADYSVVSVSGAGVADYVAASQPADGRRNLKVIFAGDFTGRQLIRLHLEKNIAAADGPWPLPRIEYPEAKSVRGDIGVVGAAGYRVAIDETEQLAEQPLSYFPQASRDLQQAFRIRQADWSATMQIESLEGSVQADVLHLYSLSQGAVYGSALVNYFVTGAPVSEWRLAAPRSLGNIVVDGQDVRTWRRDDDQLIVTLHQPVMGPYTLLVTFEEKPAESDGAFQAGVVTPLGVQGERGYVHVVSPMLVELETVSSSDDLLKLDSLELPAEFRLLSTAPPLGTWQYTDRPFNLSLQVKWFQPGETAAQVVEFSEATSRVSQDGELVTDIVYFVKSRGQRTLRVNLPPAPVRLWEVTVAGRPVTARQANDATLIPLPGGADPNVPVEVRLRLGKPTISESQPVLTLPRVAAPVLKTVWDISGDPQRVLVPSSGTVDPPLPVLRPTGYAWVARNGLLPLVMIGVLTGIALVLRQRNLFQQLLALLASGLAVLVTLGLVGAAVSDMRPPAPLRFSLPVMAAEEMVEVSLSNTSLWWANLSVLGVVAILGGLYCVVRSLVDQQQVAVSRLLAGGVFLIIFGVLLQRDSAAWFFGLLAIGIFGRLCAPLAVNLVHTITRWWRAVRQRRAEKSTTSPTDPPTDPGPGSEAVATLLLLGGLVYCCSASTSFATPPAPAASFQAADAITQDWQLWHQQNRLTASGTVTVTGQPGDRFVLLRAPAVLTKFEGEGLQLTKQQVPGQGLAYIVSIPLRGEARAEDGGKPAEQKSAEQKPDEQKPDEQADEEEQADEQEQTDEQEADDKKQAADQKQADNDRNPAEPKTTATPSKQYKASFEYRIVELSLGTGVPVLTGTAAVREITLGYDQADWQVLSPGAVRIEQLAAEGDSATRARVLLGTGAATLMLKPRTRDVSQEETEFYVEASNLYLPGPGVVDGRHRLHLRTSQGEVSELTVNVPAGLTVSEVSGPVGAWQFDADSGQLLLQIEPARVKAAQSQGFDIRIDTQRGLAPLPTDVTLAPLKVVGAEGEVGLVAVAFTPDAQPEQVEPQGLSAVNLGDFDASLLPTKPTVLHRVYRYGAEGGQLAVRVAPVASEVRVLSKQVVSFGDERIVFAVNFLADISRAGLFRLSFPLPDGFEVESLTGAALDHWSELNEQDQRSIVLHLNGKTLGQQKFALTLTGRTPDGAGEWRVPRFELNEATRQTGELAVQPATGIRLRTVSRQNVSEADPRALGATTPGALAFRLLQRDWDLTLGVEKLQPWVTGQVLHEVTLREGQTRSTLNANFNVQNASIRSLRVALPITDADEIKTLRATGKIVSDMVRTAPNSNLWEIRFKRRIVDRFQFRIEYERRGDRSGDSETLRPAEFPDARQLAYYFAVRAGGRLELEYETLPRGWERTDWGAVPQVLRDSGGRSAPAISLRLVAPTGSLAINAIRHALADALKLRVTRGQFTTVLSPTGDQLTAADLTMEVIQRRSMSLQLPAGGELFSIFVNDESVHSVRQEGPTNAWRFHVLPGIDDRTAKVRFVYSLPGSRIHRLRIGSPQLDVPLENIRWNVVVPEGFVLRHDDGNLKLVDQTQEGEYNRKSYLSKISSTRISQASKAAALLETANRLLQQGEQKKANWALNNVFNQNALDAASNEDARVQLETLQCQNALVGLSTRRQRIYLDNAGAGGLNDAQNDQLLKAAAGNLILQQEDLNYRPQQLSQLLQGNTREGNAVLQRIANRLVQHQRTTEPAPQAITISLPEEGSVYTFARSVQVAESAPLKLDLTFDRQEKLGFWQTVSLLVLLVGFVSLLATRKRAEDEQADEAGESEE